MFLEFFCGRPEGEKLLGGGDSKLGYIGVEVVVVVKILGIMELEGTVDTGA